MKIEIGKIYENRTKMLLAPGLKHYGDSFVQRFNSDLFKLAYGINDKIYNNESKLEGRNPIFIMVDRAVKPQLSWQAIEWIRCKPFYITDYPAEVSSFPRKHIIVLDYPIELKDAYKYFIKGYYSKMYSKEQLDKYFQKDSIAYKILTKDSSYMPVFISKIEQVFDVVITDKSSYIDSELEFPFLMNMQTIEEETFNF